VFHQLLIAHDGSEPSRIAAHAAIDLAAQLRAQVTLLTVSPPFHIEKAEDPVLLLDVEKDYVTARTHLAESWLRPCEQYAQSRRVEAASLHVFDDQPWRAIVDTAKRAACDLICVGSHGHSGLLTLMLGSTSYRVLVHATVPVLVHRARGE
jgi:nucleotide-binding universal stress UspA family protein